VTVPIARRKKANNKTPAVPPVVGNLQISELNTEKSLEEIV
jgi:hypothetical protein